MKVILFCLALICLLAVPVPMVMADRSDDPVLVRRLVSRNRAIRSQTLAELESNRGAAVDSLQHLVTAAQKLSDSVVESNAGDLSSVDPYVVRLIHLIGSINDDLSERGLVDLLDSPNPGIAMIAADTLGKNKFYDSIDFLKRQLDHAEYKKSYAFRFNLLRALIQMEHPDAIEFVAAQADKVDGQLRHKINQTMLNVTVDDFRGDQKRFQEWSASRDPANSTIENSTIENSTIENRANRAAESKAGSIFKNASHEPESLQRIRLAKQQYYGIEIHAKRLMFIIDHSGSMKEYDHGQTRLDRAKVELIRAIESLEEDTEFALVFYNTKIASWRDELVPATEQNKKAAKHLIRGLRPGDFTNTHGALRKSLEFDESLEAVFLLTDGQPTAGEIVRPDSIIDDILHRNRFRHLNFNTIGIALSESTERFLQTLAVESGGEFRAAK